MGDNWDSGAPENHWTTHDSFPIFKHVSCEPYIKVNSADWFRWKFHHWDFWMATYLQCEWGILLLQQSQLHPTDAQAQWPVYWESLYGGDIVISSTRRLVQFWLCENHQPTVHYRYMAKYTQSPSVTSPNNSGRPHYPPWIIAGISFERNACLWSVQKYQINLTQKCIRRFWNSQLWTPILETNWGGLGTRSLCAHAQIWSESTHRQYIHWTSEWVVVLPSTISEQDLCWASGTSLQGRIYQCQQKDHVWSSWHLGAEYAKWWEWPR